MFTGAGTGCWEVLAGLRLAQLTHAPNLCFTMGGTGALNPRLRYLPPSLNGDEGLADCEARVGLEELFDLELGGAFDIMFVSGMQMDQYGNVNLVCVGPHDKPAFRGPGTVGLEFAPCVPRWVAFFRSHTKQVFVDKVDFVSGKGYGPRAESNQQVGTPDDRGPMLVITNLAVMDFCPDTKRLRLKSVHPGCTVDQVKENTGFELVTSAKVPETILPTHAELLLLRNEIDRGGLLASLIP
jgi:glutaconate CoA-transferase subunit B